MIDPARLYSGFGLQDPLATFLRIAALYLTRPVPNSRDTSRHFKSGECGNARTHDRRGRQLER